MIVTETAINDGARHGAQGVLDSASKATLENEFGTNNEDECMMKILEQGAVQETEVTTQNLTKASGPCLTDISVQNAERQAHKNETKGARQAH